MVDWVDTFWWGGKHLEVIGKITKRNTRSNNKFIFLARRKRTLKDQGHQSLLKGVPSLKGRAHISRKEWKRVVWFGWISHLSTEDGAFFSLSTFNYCLSLLLLAGRGGQTPQSTQICCIIGSPGTSWWWLLCPSLLTDEPLVKQLSLIYPPSLNSRLIIRKHSAARMLRRYVLRSFLPTVGRHASVSGLDPLFKNRGRSFILF